MSCWARNNTHSKEIGNRMNVGAILAGIGILIVAAAYVARPLYQRSSNGGQNGAANAVTRAQLIARRDAVYALIRELDTDYQTGKVNSEDYQAQRGRYVAEGVSVLRQLDALTDEKSHPDLDAEIEAQVLALRKVHATPTDNGQEPPTAFCTQCGQPADPEHRFCASCGASLKGVVTQ
jgi:type II secretory pathway pseudopilin PulG